MQYRCNWKSAILHTHTIAELVAAKSTRKHAKLGVVVVILLKLVEEVLILLKLVEEEVVILHVQLSL